MNFDEILQDDNLLDALWDMHFDKCTPIQEQAIPPVLAGRDILACAQTGTGKTAAYLLPVIEKIVSGDYPSDCVNCVIMAPTRELAQQIDQQMQGFSYFMPVSSIAIYGGTNGETYTQQRRSLKMGADVVIATPGRLLSHLSMGYVDLSKVSFFILDEADRMLDMGFLDDIMQIIGRLPKDRQTLMFSATMPDKIQQLAKRILNDPVEIRLAVSKPAERIRQSAYVCYETQKLELIRKIFQKSNYRKVIIFSSSKLKVKELNKALRKIGLKSSEMHSDLDQSARDEVILNFKAGKINILVATDILSRGIDIDDIELVVNYDVPHEAEDYVHRVGRTARAERSGRAITFISERDQRKFKSIETLLEREVEKIPMPEDIGQGPDYERKSGSSGNRHKANSRRRKSVSGNKTENKQVAKKTSADNTLPNGSFRNKKRRYHGNSRKKTVKETVS